METSEYWKNRARQRLNTPQQLHWAIEREKDIAIREYSARLQDRIDGFLKMQPEAEGWENQRAGVGRHEVYEAQHGYAVEYTVKIVYPKENFADYEAERNTNPWREEQ